MEPVISARIPAVERMDSLEKLLESNLDFDPEYVEEVLVRVLASDADPVVRHEAAFVLGKLHQRGKISGQKALDQLCWSAFSDSSVIVRHESAETLGYFNDPRAAAALERLAADPNPDVAATAQIGLARLARNRDEAGEDGARHN
jgi:HEAT repeat protein